MSEPEVPSSSPDAAVLACPVCAEPLQRNPGSWRCGQGHGYDVAREGYVNLLLPQHRHSKDPGYSRDMITGRRDLFDAGLYRSLADDVARWVADYLPGRPGQAVVDAGCGEGYYLRRLRDELDQRRSVHTVRCGLDLSKHGIRLAAKRDPAGLYAVAGTFRMPVLAERVDVLLAHFSPVSPADFARVVRPGGIVLVGGPGESHLFSFKQLLYDAPVRHQPVDQLAEDSRFKLVRTHRSRHPLELREAEQVGNLLVMTPFYWTLDASAQARLSGVHTLDTEIDVVLRAYRRTGAPPGPVGSASR